VERAERLKPRLVETRIDPVRLVEPVADTSAHLRWRMESLAPAGSLSDRLLRAGDSIVLDFGTHVVGHLKRFV